MTNCLLSYGGGQNKLFNLRQSKGNNSSSAGDKKYLSRHKLVTQMTVGRELYQCTKTFPKRTLKMYSMIGLEG